MNKEQRNVPKLRFPEFTGEWEKRKLGEVVINIRNGYNYKADGRRDHKYKITRIESISSGEINTDKLGSSDTINEDYRLEDGDILFSHINSLPYIANTALYTTDLGIIYHGMNLLNIRANHSAIDAHFLLYLLKKEDSRAWFRTIAKPAVNQCSLGTGDVTSFMICMPSLAEQQQVGKLLTNFDTLITLQQRKLDQIKEYKKGMLQKMFPKDGASVPEVRFPGFTGEWEQKKLGELAEVKDSARIPNSEWTDSGVPYIRASDLTNDDTSGVLFISSERYDYYRSKTGAPAQGDVLFNGGGEIGKALLHTNNKPIYVQGGAVLYARTSVSESLDGQFLKTYFETPNAKSYIDIASAGGTMKHFTLKPSLEMPIQFPNIPEQLQLGSFFKSLDTLITLQQRKLDAMKEYKKGLLQQMFV